MIIFCEENNFKNYVKDLYILKNKWYFSKTKPFILSGFTGIHPYIFFFKKTAGIHYICEFRKQSFHTYCSLKSTKTTRILNHLFTILHRLPSATLCM